MRSIALAMVVLATVGAASMQKGKVTPADRQDVIRRAQVWAPTDVPAMDLRAGPAGPKAFEPNQLVECDYVDKSLNGKSPKFACAVAPGDEVKVKYGADNGEVFAEVAATRLLWALGFAADAMYPVRINCHGCPEKFTGKPTKDKPPILVDPATIERKLPGHTIEVKQDSGWEWSELDLIDETAGGAPRAQRDALRLLAALIQHTDNKAEQQRIICPKSDANAGTGTCAAPVMMINDLGLTFGHANTFNSNSSGSVNFEDWSRTKVWADSKSCAAELKKSMTGTLDHPVISEAGRKFLADLLAQLTDQQLHDLFDVSRFAARGHSVDEWVDAFKHKRDEIVTRTCPA
jgi:hypothetical protein